MESNPGDRKGEWDGEQQTGWAVSDRHESQKAAQVSSLGLLSAVGGRGVAWRGVDPCRWKWGFDHSWQRRLERRAWVNAR
jgi:hypothetical protein